VLASVAVFYGTGVLLTNIALTRIGVTEFTSLLLGTAARESDTSDTIFGAT